MTVSGGRCAGAFPKTASKKIAPEAAFLTLTQHLPAELGGEAAGERVTFEVEPGRHPSELAQLCWQLRREAVALDLEVGPHFSEPAQLSWQLRREAVALDLEATVAGELGRSVSQTARTLLELTRTHPSCPPTYDIFVRSPSCDGTAPGSDGGWGGRGEQRP